MQTTCWKQTPQSTLTAMGRERSIKYPRRRAVRWALRAATGLLVHRLGHLRVTGLDNVPARGPVILAPNHFDFVDAPLVLYTSPRMVEFIGGAERPNSPGWAQKIPQAWGFIRAYRGGFSRATLTQSLDVLAQGGVLGIFPEAGSWAPLLRPARPGMAFLADKANVPVVPVSITGATDLFGGPKRPVGVAFHPPLDPPNIEVNGRDRRAALDEYGRDVMRVIASGLPSHQQGEFSEDPAARAAAEAVSDYPFHAPEMRGL